MKLSTLKSILRISLTFIQTMISIQFDYRHQVQAYIASLNKLFTIKKISVYASNYSVVARKKNRGRGRKEKRKEKKTKEGKGRKARKRKKKEKEGKRKREDHQTKQGEGKEENSLLFLHPFFFFY